MYTCLISAQCELLSLVFFIVYKPEESSRTAVKTLITMVGLKSVGLLYCVMAIQCMIFCYASVG